MKKSVILLGVIMFISLVFAADTFSITTTFTKNSPYSTYAFEEGGNIFFNFTVPNNSSVYLMTNYGNLWNATSIANDLIYYSDNVGDNTEITYNATAMPIKPNSDLVYLYRFDNISAFGENDTFFMDYSNGNEDNISCVGSACPTFTSSGRFAGARTFDGVDDALILNGQNDYNVTNFTIMAWTKFAEINGSKVSPIITKYNAAIGYDYFLGTNMALGFNGFGVGFHSAAWSAPQFVNISLDTFNPNQWYHVAATYDTDNNDLTLFVDGVAVASNSSITSDSYDSDSKSAITIGNSLTSYFNGTIDEVAIWNKSLSANEIADIYRLKMADYGWGINVSNSSGEEWDYGAYKVIESSTCNITGQYPNNTDCSYIGERFITSSIDGTIQPYWIELPVNFNSSLTYPLIINLHGRTGTAYSMAVSTSNFKKNISDNGWIYISPHYRGGYSWMYPVAASDVMDTINDVKTLYNINSSRIHIEGGSMGGGAALTFTKFYPNVIASSFDYMGATNFTKAYNEYATFQSEMETYFSGTPDEVPAQYQNISALGNEKYFKDTPVKLIHGTTDALINVSHSRFFNTSMSNLGYSINFTELNLGHVSSIIYGYETEILDFFTTYTLADRSAPYVTLQTENDSSQSGTSATLICNSFDLYNTTNVTLYGDWSGSWEALETNSSGIDEVNYTFTPSISSSGNYSWNCYACDNLSQCDFATENYTLDFTYVAPAVEEEETTPQSGGGTPSYSVGAGALQDGYTKSLGRFWRLRFNVGDEAHNLRLNSINYENKTVNITVKSNPQTKILSVGENWKVNLDDDNYYDLLVRLDNVTRIRAEIFLQEIHEDINPQKDDIIEDVTDDATKEEVGINWLFIVVEIVLVLIILGLAFWIGKKYLKK